MSQNGPKAKIDLKMYNYLLQKIKKMVIKKALREKESLSTRRNISCISCEDCKRTKRTFQKKNDITKKKMRTTLKKCRKILEIFIMNSFYNYAKPFGKLVSEKFK